MHKQVIYGAILKDGSREVITSCQREVQVNCQACQVLAIVALDDLVNDRTGCPGCGRQFGFMMKLGGRHAHGADYYVFESDIETIVPIGEVG